MDKFTATDMVASKPSLQNLLTLLTLQTAELKPPAPLNLSIDPNPPTLRPDMVSPPTSGSLAVIPLGAGVNPGYA